MKREKPPLEEMRMPADEFDRIMRRALQGQPPAEPVPKRKTTKPKTKRKKVAR